MAGKTYVGIGGWTFEPWRGTFYPDGLVQRRELEYASRHVTSIEINGTYYSTFKPPTWAKWRDETPDGFVFAVKASRFCTNRRRLAEAGDSIAKFMGQGLDELGDKLGPINWQFMGTKKFDAEDIAAFLAAAAARDRRAAAAPCARGAPCRASRTRASPIWRANTTSPSSSPTTTNFPASPSRRRISPMRG